MLRRLAALALSLPMLLAAPVRVLAQEGDGDLDSRPRRQLVPQAELDLGFTTLSLGGDLLFDAGSFDQDGAAEDQVPLESDLKLRDARLMFGGRIATKRLFTWQTGIMWDKPTGDWFIRQTGLTIGLPEIWSRVFVGRGKEGFSAYMATPGLDLFGMERAAFIAAAVPLLADGVKVTGHTPDGHWFWSLGGYTDWLSEGQTFSAYEYQLAARAAWIPVGSDSVGTLVHVGLNFRIGAPNDDSLQLKSKPEMFVAPLYIDTGKFPADRAWAAGPELYVRPGRLALGAEYYVQSVRSPETGDPWFHGGEVFLAWLVTGETRHYNPDGGYFRAVSPTRTVIEGGPGAWEVVVRLTYADLDDGSVEGGTFRKFTPMLNWHLTDNVRLAFVYGEGWLDRFGFDGRTRFFQTRIQMQL